MNNQVIYAHISYPSDNKTRATCTSIQCSNSHNCGLYKRNECILLGILNTQSCPYGVYTKSQGYTKKAKSYKKWINQQKEAYPNTPNKLKCYKFILTQIGDFIFLPYSYMNMNNEIPFLRHATLFTDGSYLLPKQDFTIKNIINICEFKPRALIGEEITTYQQKEIPEFLQHLSQQFPDIFSELSSHYERAKNLLNTFTHVGRQAYLRTLTPSAAPFNDIHGGIWNWDGQYLISTNSKMSFGPIHNFIETKLKPHPNAIIQVSNDNQINPNTEFC